MSYAFATKGLSRGDKGYHARYDLDGDGTIGFGDFVIFANAFGKDLPACPHTFALGAGFTDVVLRVRMGGLLERGDTDAERRCLRALEHRQK